MIGRARPWIVRDEETTGTPGLVTSVRSAGMAWPRPPPDRIATSSPCGASMSANRPPGALGITLGAATDEPDITQNDGALPPTEG